MAKKNAQTPMMEQYFRIKKEYEDSLLFFRLGDFYEMFYDDAHKASAVLEIALTSRQKVPMCGVPYHAAPTYLAKLLKHGFKVAICEQVEDPATAKGVVKRDVVKVLTPGTALEVDSADSKNNTYVASLFFDKDNWGLAVIDLASGQIKTTQRDPGMNLSLTDELFKFAPKEIAFPAGQTDQVNQVLAQNGIADILKSPQDDWVFDFTQAKHSLQDHFQVKSLAGFDLADKSLAVAAAGALLHYLKSLRKDSLDFIRTISYLQASETMLLDSTTIRNLELVRNLRDGHRQGSLLEILDFTVSSMGGRLLKSWLLHPLLDRTEIEARQDAVAELMTDTIIRQDLREGLDEIMDLERLTGKISLAIANARDLIALNRSLLPLPRLQGALQAFQSFELAAIHTGWDNAEDLVELISSTLKDEPAFLLTEGGLIREGFNSELDELRQISRSGKTFITGLEKKEKERTGISSLKIRFNKVFGYYIDVTKPNLHLVPDDYIRKQTLVNSERFITPELKEYEEKVLNAEERSQELEYRLFQELRERTARETGRLQKVAAAVARLDVFCALAELAVQRGYRRPHVNSHDRIHIQDGRHPVIEVTQDEPFIPNDTYVDRDEDQILIITGPNMGGKSTFLRQVALICILAQMGSFVPAREAEIGVVDRIFTRIGAMDFLSVGQSTFMVEMLETANILNNATSNSLILLDEVGRGTSTFDGLSLAWAIAEYLHERDTKAKTLFATHYHELTELSLTLSRIKNYHVTVKEQKDDIIFLRKIVAGPSDQSYGIHVAKLAGIPRAVVDRAQEILFNLEKKELDESGHPKIAYRSSSERDKNQFLLFDEDRERDLLARMKEDLQKIDLNSLTPLEALNYLDQLQKCLKDKD
jgi:DNA mismatch repair protein MutS